MRSSLSSAGSKARGEPGRGGRLLIFFRKGCQKALLRPIPLISPHQTPRTPRLPVVKARSACTARRSLSMGWLPLAHTLAFHVKGSCQHDPLRNQAYYRAPAALCVLTAESSCLFRFRRASLPSSQSLHVSAATLGPCSSSRPNVQQLGIHPRSRIFLGFAARRELTFAAALPTRRCSQTPWRWFAVVAIINSRMGIPCSATGMH